MKYDYDNLNHTELETLARQHGLLAPHRGLDRTVLIGQIEGRIHAGDVPADPVDVERNSMMYVQEKWPEVFHQLKCSDEYYACWDCPAARVIACVIEECEAAIIEKVRRGDI